MSSEIEKQDQSNPEDILTAIQSFNDPSIIINMFKELGWTYSLEIRETITLAKQNANLSIKFKAVKYLRELLREASETAGYTAKVSETYPNPEGGQTTFSARRIAGILNPVKQIKSTIKEPQNEKIQETDKSKTKQSPIRDKFDRESNRPESQRPAEGDAIRSTGNNSGKIQRGSSGGTDTSEQFPIEQCTGRTEPSGDAIFGGLESEHGEPTPEQQRGPDTGNEVSGNPCIHTRPPTCNQDLYPGISTSAEDD